MSGCRQLWEADIEPQRNSINKSLSKINIDFTRELSNLLILVTDSIGSPTNSEG